MRLINICIAVISGGFFLTYIIFGLDFMSKERLIDVTKSVIFLIFLFSICGVYISFKNKE